MSKIINIKCPLFMYIVQQYLQIKYMTHKSGKKKVFFEPAQYGETRSI